MNQNDRDMPDWAIYQLNDLSPYQNYMNQKKKMLNQISKQYKAKRQEEFEKELEKRVNDAIFEILIQSGEDYGNMIAGDIANEIQRAIGCGSPAPSPKPKDTFSQQLGAVAGRVLAEMPFKWLHDTLSYDD